MKMKIEIPKALEEQIRRNRELYDVSEKEVLKRSQKCLVGFWEDYCGTNFVDLWRYGNREEAVQIAGKLASSSHEARSQEWQNAHNVSYEENGESIEETVYDLLNTTAALSPSRKNQEKLKYNCAPVDAEGHPTLFGFGVSIFLFGGGGRCGFTPHIHLGRDDDHPPILRSWLDKLAGGLDKRYYSTPGRMLYVVPFAETNRLPSIEGASIDEAYIAGKNVEVVTTHLKGLELLTHLRGLIADRRPRDIVIWPASYYFSGSGEEIMHQLARGLNWEHEQYEARAFALSKVTATVQPETVAT
ncbi:MAG TPA: hypothetical protein VFT72_01210 [Opitutaceae bacterium]|nr:hypothetical protein [Opitutaceae bacterium]